MTYTVDAKQLELMNKLLDKTFGSEDDEFLMGLLNATSEGTATDYTKMHGFDFKDINWRIIKEVSKLGPYFDLRMAGGLYRFEANVFDFYELLVDSAKMTVLVDGEPAESVQVRAGSVEFSIKAEHHFELSFECSQILGEGKSNPSFMGHCTVGGNDKKVSITGRKFYLWGDVQDQTDVETEHVPDKSQKVPEEKLTLIESARDDASSSSLSVAIDFMSTIYTPPKNNNIDLMAVDNGDLYLEGIHVAATILGAGLGAFITGGGNPVGGAAAGAAGAQASRVVTAEVKKKYQTKQIRKMKNYIAIAEVDMKQMLKEQVEKLVNEYPRDYLENSGMVDDIRGKLEAEYKLEATAQLRRSVRKKFSAFHHLYKTDYDSTFETAVGSKFKAEVSDTFLKGLVEKQRDERLITKDLPTEIAKLQEQQKTLEEKKKKELREIGGLPPDEQNEKREEIRKKYEKDLAPIEGQLKDKTGKEKDLKDKDPGQDIDGRIDDLEKEAEARRQREAEAQKERRRGGKP